MCEVKYEFQYSEISRPWCYSSLYVRLNCSIFISRNIDFFLKGSVGLGLFWVYLRNSSTPRITSQASTASRTLPPGKKKKPVASSKKVFMFDVFLDAIKRFFFFHLETSQKEAT